ncbi:MAG: DNA helicase RecQ [Bacillota bacterium]
MLSQPQSILEEYFGYQSFRPGQKEIIENILAGHNTLGVMPTGGGKSICFQIPALCLSGTTIVFSPLISLMKDQIDTLRSVGINATFINSSLTALERQRRLQGVQRGEYELLYIAPERLQSEQFIRALQQIEIPLVVVDEAHCISQWGHDFRPYYLAIPEVVKQLPSCPHIAAFTATATEDVRDDIGRILDITAANRFITTFNRENLKFEVVSGEDKREFITNYISSNREEAGIIYAATRKEVDQLYNFLYEQGFAVGRYHAGLEREVRKETQDDFLYDRIRIVVATNAFGMGIDKSNVRYVIHHNLPKNIESYYQEAGRAGRDGKISECVLLFAPGDIRLPKYFISESDLPAKRKKLAYQKLQRMIDYAYTDRCLRGFILNYFGEEDVAQDCNSCGNCQENQSLVDRTIEAQKILSCVYKLNEQYGTTKVAKVLKGSKSQEILELELDQVSTYGIMSQFTIKEIKNLIKFLVADGYIDLTDGKYPILKLNSRSYDVLQQKEEVWKQDHSTSHQISETDELFDILRNVRLKIARAEELAPFVIFHDQTLQEMVEQLPTTKEEMLEVSGVGRIKFKKYGAEFLAKIKEYQESNQITKQEKEDIRTQLADGKVVRSHHQSFKLYQQGQDLEEIAKQRDLTVSTVQSHLLKAAKEGLAVDLDFFIPDDYKDIIVQKIKQEESNKLSPVKEALPEEVTYFQIKVVLQQMQAGLLSS